MPRSYLDIILWVARLSRSKPAPWAASAMPDMTALSSQAFSSRLQTAQKPESLGYRVWVKGEREEGCWVFASQAGIGKLGVWIIGFAVYLKGAKAPTVGVCVSI